MIEQTSRPFTGRRMLALMLSFFAVILSANMTMVYFANHSWTRLVVKNSYVASQEFNATTEKREKAAANVHVAVIYDAGKLFITLRDNHGNAVAGQDVLLKLGRPSNEGEDKSIYLTSEGNGVFAADVAIAKGQWAGTVSAQMLGRPEWQRAIRIVVKE
jgi:nitrogen fixation protein FixH